MQPELERIRDWAKDKLQSGSEPPWAWYQYMKLVETADAILAGMSATSPMENSQQSVERQGTHLQLVGSTYPQDNAQSHPAGPPVLLPM